QLPKSKMKENLIANADKARLSRELVRLKVDVPMPLEWDSWRVREWDAPKLLPIFEGAGFRSLSTRVRSSIGKAPAAEPIVADQPVMASARPKGGGDLFSDIATEAPPAPRRDPNWHGDYELIDTADKFADFLKALRKQKRFAIDLETTSLDA